MSIKSDLLFWLHKHDIKPNKDLGQCFLVAGDALNKIITAADIKPGEKVLEIGSGTGILTEKLLTKGASVLGVEKDSRLVLILHERFEKDLRIGKLKLVQTDFLDLPFPETLQRLGWRDGNYKVVANLPYQITSPIIERLLERNFLPNTVVITVQKEVAERICAQPGDLTSLAVLIQLCAQKCTLVAKFPRGCFFPAPKVDSALIKLESLTYPVGIEIKDLRQVVRVGFSQKRKKLKKNLQHVFSAGVVENIWSKSSLSENTRAQELRVEQWVEIARKIFSVIPAKAK